MVSQRGTSNSLVAEVGMTNNNHLYSDLEAKMDTLIGGIPTPDGIEKYNHWRTLQIAKAEYDNIRIEQGLKFELDAFSNWLESTYGVRLHRVDQMIGQTFEVVDEAKYTFYKLKFA